MEVPQSEVHQYGVIKGREIKKRLYQVEATVEKPLAEEAPSRMAIIGRYVLRPEIFQILQNLAAGTGRRDSAHRRPIAIGSGTKNIWLRVYRRPLRYRRQIRFCPGDGGLRVEKARP